MAAINKLVLLQKKILILIILRRRFRGRIGKYKKSMWVRQLFKDRARRGEFNILVKDMMMFDHFYFFQTFRMHPHILETLISWVGPFIKKSSFRRETTSPAERLCLTLRYLATGDAQISLATRFRISPATVGRIIRETCQVLWNVLSEKGYLDVPNSKEKWLKIANDFRDTWNFPNCIGAIDGKHVVIQAPPRSGSMFYNYKKTYSIVLLAVCNANYEFTLVDVGEYGRQSDSGVYTSSNLGHAIDNNLLNIPTPRAIPGYHSNKMFPFTFVADEAFALKTFMMRPFPRRNVLDSSETIFNYRLSRARRVIENSFGILASRFRIFRRPIIANADNVKFITKAAIALHNFLMKSQSATHTYCPPELVDQETMRFTRPGQWRSDITNGGALTHLVSQGSHNFTRDAKTVREDFKVYFNSIDGAVGWQEEMVNSTTNPFDEEY